jgi:hypothetical protein
MKVALKYPVTDADGERFEELTFRRPVIKDLKALDTIKGDVDKISTLILRLATSQTGSQITPFAVDNIDAEDFAKIGEVIGSFLETSPQTTGK